MLRAVTLVLTPVEVAAFTVPLALLLLLTETALGTFVTTEALRLRGGITPGFLKFMAATSTVLMALALLVSLGVPVEAYRDLLPITRPAATLLPALIALAAAWFLVVALATFRSQRSNPLRIIGLGLVAALAAVLGILLVPLGVTWWGQVAIVASILASTAILGTSTTGMLLGHWYLVTPALTNRPLLRSIAWLLGALVVGTAVFLVELAGVRPSSASALAALQGNPILAVLWALGAVVLPLLSAGLAYPACRLRAFMSATGLLYLAMIAIFPGQLVGQILLFSATR